MQLHAFADASRRVIAAAIYLRACDPSLSTVTYLVAAKTKLTSIKSQANPDKPPVRMTIPRLELRGTLLAARLLRSVAEGLDIPLHGCFIWSDSQVALHWLRSTGPVGNNLVDNYVSHIQEIAHDCTLRYVNTTENPADLGIRGCDVLALAGRALWWSGPTWLAGDASDWPQPVVNPLPAITR